MTKKSSRRIIRDRNKTAEIKEAVPEVIRFREVQLAIPMVLWKRMEVSLEQVQMAGLLPKTTTMREWALLLVINGQALAEADLKSKKEERHLIVTPEEAARKWGLTNR